MARYAWPMQPKVGSIYWIRRTDHDELGRTTVRTVGCGMAVEVGSSFALIASPEHNGDYAFREFVPFQSNRLGLIACEA